MKKLLLSILGLMLFASAASAAITATTYPFTTSTGASLEDLSSGATTIVSSGQDDTASAVADISFDFWFDGVRYSQFSANANGLVKLGPTSVTTAFTNSMASATDIPKIAPYWDDVATGTNGTVRYKVVGSAPNRKLVIEWQNSTIPRSVGSTGAATFQAWLYESTGKIELVYGSGIVAGSSYSVGIGSSATQFASVTTPGNTVAYGTANDLNTAAITSGQKFTFTPSIPADPGALSYTAVGLNTMTLNWADNATNEVGYAVYRSVDGVTYNFIRQLAANTTSSVEGGLASNTTYFWKVFAVTEGGLSANPGTSPAHIESQATTTGTLSGTQTIGPTGTYASITAAVTAINTSGLNGNLILELQAAYTSAAEPAFPVAINTLGSPSNTITIRPETGATALSITSAALQTLNLNGATNVTIDGRAGGAGASQLTISNTSATGNAVQFINDALRNTIQYVTVQGVNGSTTSGVILFSTTTGVRGNDENTIDNCDLRDGASTPSNIVYSLGTTTTGTLFNSGNTISNSRIFNYFQAGLQSAGINIAGGNTEWTISNNSFFQQATRTATAGSTHYGILYANLSGNNNVITGNFIGGGAANAGGTAWTMAGAFANRFVGIQGTVGAVPTSIQGNTITNFTWSSTSGATTAPGVWCGIHIPAGSANIGTTSGNTIGSGTGTGAVTATISTSAGICVGISTTGSSTNGGIFRIVNNTIGSITPLGSSASVAHGFTGILHGFNNATISGNTLGSTTTANSINSSTVFTGTGTNQTMIGISSASAATVSVTNNTIANWNNAMTSTPTTAVSAIRGIVTTSGINTITGNTIRNLSTASGTIGTGTTASLIGISQTSATGTAPAASQIVSQNTIHSLSSSAATAVVSAVGIHFTGSTATGVLHTIARNFVHSISVASTGALANITGINAAGGLSQYQNNMVRLGIDAAGASLTQSTLAIVGIADAGTSLTNNFYHNSVWVGGTVSTGAGTATSFAYRRTATGTQDVKDNAFVNVRSNTVGTGKSYGIGINATTTFTSNFNVVNVSGTNTFFGLSVAADQATLANWQATTLQDGNSIFADPQFINPTGTAATVDLHIHPTNPTPVEAAGTLIASVVDDFDGQTRSTLTPVDIGADAGNFTPVDLSPPVITYTALGNTTSTSNRTLVSTITDGTGVPQSGVGLPVVYYRKGVAGAFASTQAVWTTPSTYTFTIDYSLVTGGSVAVGDTIQYYVVAQDTAATPNLASNPAGGSGFTANPPAAATPPTTPSSYMILGSIMGTFNVGTIGGGYPTLTAAVADLNSKVITGPVVFNLTDPIYNAPESTETYPITINANSGSSATNTVTIKPASGNTVTMGNATGTTTAIIILNGADYVTIDGSNNGTSSRDMTITNANAGTSSAVVWLQTAGADGATNNVVKNLNLVGSGNTQTLFGVGSGSSTISTSSLGTGNNNNTFQNNNISKVQYGIYSQGASAANKNSGNIITQNLMNTASPNNVSKGGIWLGFENNIQVTQNNISGVTQASSPDVFGIALGLTGISTTSFTGNEVTNATVSRNFIGTVTNTGTFSAVGISVASATSGTNQISNNSIYGVGANGTAGDFGAGIFLGGGVGSTTTVYFNSISMTGTFTGGSYPNYCLAIGGTDPVVNVRNNTFYNTQANGTGVSIAIGTASSTFVNLTSNYNDFFVTAGGGLFKIGKTGSLSQGTGTEYTLLSDWVTATGRDTPNSISANPLFNSATNLQPQTGSPLLLAGVTGTGVTIDITGGARGATPTIGAYETAIDTSAPTITYTPLGNTASTSNAMLVSTITDGTGVPQSGVGLPVIYFRKGMSGAFASTQGAWTTPSTYTFTIDYSLVTGGSVMVGDTIQYYVVAQDTAGTPNVIANPSAGAGSYTANPPAAGTPPTTPNSYMIVGTIMGTFTVGSGGNYPTLTGMNGAITDLNNKVMTGPVVFNLVDPTYNTPQSTETYPITINANPGASATNTITIKPASGNTVTMTGSAAATAVFKLNGADYVTIDGSNNGTSSQDLTIASTNAAGVVVWIGSASASDGASNNTIKNVKLVGTATAGTIAGVLAGSGTTLGNAAESPNSNNTIQNTVVTKCQNGAYISGNVASLDQNWMVLGNTFGSSVAAEKLGFRGMLIGSAQNFVISGNTIKGIVSTTSSSSTMTGIQLAFAVNGGAITANKISDIKQINTTGWGSNGIYLAQSSTTANVTVANNFIWDVASQGFAGVLSSDNGYGIMIDTGAGYKIYDNSVSLNTNQVATGSITAAINIASAVTTAGGIDLRGNILADSQTVGTRYGAYVGSTAAIFASPGIDYNDYFAQNVGFLGSAQATLANWQTATGQDLNSKAVDPVFVSAANLHLQLTSTLIGMGVTIPGILLDIDGETRLSSPSSTTIGADEVIPYTVSYNANGGTGTQTDPSSPYTFGSTVTVLGAGGITRTGYTFNGWNTQPGGGGTSYVAGNTFTITGNTTLYAQWTINTYTVTYDANGGTGTQTDPNSPYNYGSTVTVLGTGSIVRTGYTFSHWDTMANNMGTSYNPGDTFALGAGNVVLYAQWTINSYAVTYDGNGGTGTQTDPNSPYAYGSTVTVLGTGSIVRTGYTFANWNTAANGSGTSYNPADTFTLGAANVVLYAQWTINTYTVTYDANGGTGTQTDPNSPYNFGSTVTVLGTGSIVRTGYTFANWNTAANGSGTSYNPADTFTLGAANVVLYAQWTINTYTVTYDANGGTGTQTDPNSPYNYGSTVTVLGTGSIVRTGYTFSHWDTMANNMGTSYNPGDTFALGAGNVVLYAQWTINSYAVTYDGNGGTGTQTDPNSPYAFGSTVTVLGTGTITRTGYTFANWNTAANGSGTSYNPADTFTLGAANVVLYAQWTINTYTVMYDGNGNTGGTAPVDGSSPYNYNSSVTVLGVGSLTRTGYTFSGWNTQPGGGGTPYVAGNMFNITANVTLYAQWTLAPVTTNGGSGLAINYPSLAAAITALNAATMTSPVVITLTGNETAPAGGYAITQQGGTALNTIIIQGSASTITASGALAVGALNDAIFKLVGANWVTLQNFTMQENPANTVTTPATNNMTEWGVALLHASTTQGAQNNTIQNNTISLNRTYSNTFGVYSNVRHIDGPTSANVTTLVDITNNTTAPNSNNKVYTNAISNVDHGIVFVGSPTAANMDVGNDIGGSAAGTGNSITNFGNLGAGTAYVGYPTTLIDGVYVLNQLGSNISFNTITSALQNTGTLALRGILQDYSAAPLAATTGNVNSNTVGMSNAGVASIQTITTATQVASPNVTMNMDDNIVTGNARTTVGAGTIFGPANLGAFGTMNIRRNIVRGNTSAATTGGFVGATNQGAVTGTINILDNQIGTDTSDAVTFSAATTAGVTGISNTTGAATTTLNITGNILRRFSLVSSGQFAGIIQSGAPIGVAINLNSNQLGTATANLYTYSAAQTLNIFGIVNAAGAATATLSISNNDLRGFVHTVPASAGGTNYINNQVFTGSTNINNNTLTNLTANHSGTAAVTMLSNSVSHAAGTTHNVNGNSIVGTYTKTGGSGQITYYNAFGSSPSTVTETNNLNNFSNMNFTGTTGTNIGWRSADGTTPGSRKTITNNTFSNIIGGTGAMTSVLYVGFSDNTFAGNNVSGNTISNITNGNSITAIFSDGQNQNFFSNTVNGLSATGANAVVNGISLAGATTQNVFKNKIYDLQSNDANAAVNGILVSAGTTHNIFNNLIGDLRTPATNAANPLIGLSVTGGTTVNAYYNTIYLNATSSGALFGSSAISASTTPALTLRNNVLVNTSTANGAGLTVAYRRSSTALTTYAAASNNNDFFAPTIFTDGVNTFASMGTYQPFVATRDSASFSENPPFLSTIGSNANFLHINPAIATLLESNAVNVAGITDDFDMNIRQGNPGYVGSGTAPDVGADEFGGIAVTYTVMYDANGGMGTQTDPSSPYTFNSVVTVLGQGGITRTGYTFNGWNTQPGGGGIAYIAGNMFNIAGNTTLYAQWTINQYNLSYDGNGNTGGTAPATQMGNYNTMLTVAAQGTLVRTGYTFNGWNTQADGMGTAYAAGASFTVPASNTTLYAQWTINQYDLSYDGNGNTGGTAPATQMGNYNTMLTVAGAGTLVRTGYTFNGWNTQADGMGTAYAAGASFTVPASNTTLYAQWTINSYNLSYDGNGNTGGTAPATQMGNYNTMLTVAAQGTLVRTAYTFTGWNTQADGMGTPYAAGSSFTIPASNTTLYAQWTHPAPVVTNTNDSGANSLRQAVLDSLSGDTIVFMLPAGPNTITLLTPITINVNVVINGPANGPLTVSGGGTTRVFDVTVGTTATLSNMTIANGVASSSGGIQNNGDLTIENCTLSNNTATGGDGGAMRNDGTMKITNSTLSGNSALVDGGAILNGLTRSLTMGNVTLVKNMAGGNGGGINSAGTLVVGNSILALNSAVVLGNNVYLGGGTQTSRGYNLSSDTAGGFLTATGDQLNTDPILGPLKNNGGLSFTHAPLSNSPAIDRGKDIGANNLPTGRDQRAATRPVTYDATITPPALGDRSDIGAVELGVAVLPTSAISRKVHGAAGPFDINLPLTGPVATECRTGGATQIIVTFPASVTFSSAAVTGGTGSVSSSSGSGTTTLTVNLTGVTNAQRLTLALFGVTDGVNSGDIGIRAGVLLGDTSNSGAVDSTDITQAKAAASIGTVDAMNFRTDVNANGVINSTDVTIVKAQSGTGLPPSPTAPEPQNQ